jgi:hypothetical protein
MCCRFFACRSSPVLCLSAANSRQGYKGYIETRGNQEEEENHAFGAFVQPVFVHTVHMNTRFASGYLTSGGVSKL